MPTIKPFSALPGLDPQSLGNSIINAVAALDRLTAAGWKPVSDTFAYYPEVGAQPIVGLGGALVIDAYAATMPGLGPIALAKALMGAGETSEFHSDFYHLGDPHKLCAMVEAVRVVGCNISSDFQRLFDGHESLWPALCPNEKIAGHRFSRGTESPATERWDDLVDARWGDLYRKEVEFATPASWKRKRGPVLTHARRFGAWEVSDKVRKVLPLAFAEAESLIAEKYADA